MYNMHATPRQLVNRKVSFYEPREHSDLINNPFIHQTSNTGMVGLLAVSHLTLIQ